MFVASEFQIKVALHQNSFYNSVRSRWGIDHRSHALLQQLVHDHFKIRRRLNFFFNSFHFNSLIHLKLYNLSSGRRGQHHSHRGMHWHDVLQATQTNTHQQAVGLYQAAFNRFIATRSDKCGHYFEPPKKAYECNWLHTSYFVLLVVCL